MHLERSSQHVTTSSSKRFYMRVLIKCRIFCRYSQTQRAEPDIKKMYKEIPAEKERFQHGEFFFLSARAGGIFQILQSDWFRERAEFSDLARSPCDSARSGNRGKT